MGSLYSICTKARLRCFRDWFSKLHDLQSLIEDRSSRLVNTVMDSSAREKEAAPKQDTGALIATPEAFEIDTVHLEEKIERLHTYCEGCISLGLAASCGNT